MLNHPENILEEFNWQPQPEAASLIDELLDASCRRLSTARKLRDDLHAKTGTRLIDWVDHWAVPSEEGLGPRLSRPGFVRADDPARVVLRHSAGLFPEIEIHDRPAWRLAIKVDSVDVFLTAHRMGEETPVEGSPLGRLRKAKIASEGDAELWIAQRHGYRGWDPPEICPAEATAVRSHRERFRRRKRNFDDKHQGFDHASTLIRQAVDDLGADWASDLFFAAERDYWTRRNRAAQTQKARQDALGLGWGNHDHHTYRSSREDFTTLISVLETLGLRCRERFYAGREAGWGAQVLEQEEAGVVVFADVDLAPDEVSGDFAHEPLSPSDRLGTVGLWCRLHGEAFLEAGMHHLECRFDFAEARRQLAAQGISSMPPFTDFSYLKQAFTEGETWPLDPRRVEALLDSGSITEEQAERFRRSGAVGSHLEILQRDQGYKGFNMEGINEIIRDTDPRR